MRKKLILTMMIVLLISQGALGKSIAVSVNGMVCSFCAQGIQKKLTAQAAVKTVDVDLSHHLVTVDLREGGELGDQALTQILTDAGYSVSKIERKP